MSADPSTAPRLGPALVAAAVLTVLGTAVTTSPREDVPMWLGSLLLSGGLLWVGARRWTTRAGRAWHAPLGTRTIVLVALGLRLAALVAPVSLSDDVYRYVWDGTLLAHGQDPFASRPREVVGQHGLSPEDLNRLNSPDYYSVYPPLAQATFLIGGLARRAGFSGVATVRGVLTAAELLGVWLLVGLVRRLAYPPHWTLLYAWNPVVVWEVAGGVHTEALMLPWLLLAVLAGLDGRAGRAGVWLSLAVAAKLTAALAGPLLLLSLWRAAGWRAAARFLLAGASAAAGMVCPFWSGHLVEHVAESLRLYSETFSFNAPVYYALRWLLGYVEGVTPPVDDALVPWLVRLSVVLIVALAALGHRSARSTTAAMAWTFAVYLLLSRVMHPWYLLPVMALAAATARPALLALGSLSALSYLRYDPIGHEAPWVLFAQMLPFVVLALGELAFSSPSQVQSERISPPSDDSDLPAEPKAA